MEHAKHRICEECGKSFEPGGFSEGSVCPTCNAIFFKRMRTGFFWGGVMTLAVSVFIVLFSGVVWGDFTFPFPMAFLAVFWVFVSLLYLAPGGGWYGGWGNGGGGNGGG